jgi:hypothetical protein
MNHKWLQNPFYEDLEPVLEKLQEENLVEVMERTKVPSYWLSEPGVVFVLKAL